MKVCVICGRMFDRKGIVITCSVKCREQRRKDQNVKRDARRRETPEYKAWLAEYVKKRAKSQAYIDYQKAYQKAFRESAKGKVYRTRYEATPRRIAYKRAKRIESRPTA